MSDRVLVIGCGITGAIIARHFADKGINVDIWERRNHIAGNMYDFKDDHGILIQQYGPHVFHTNLESVHNYIKKYSKWNEYVLECKAVIDGKSTPTPFNFETIDDFYSKDDAKKLKKRIKEAFGNKPSATVPELLTHSDDMISEYARFLFEKDYSLYTAKQWGIPASEIDPSILKRVPINFSYDKRYFADKYQLLPDISFTDFIKAILDHKKINVILNKDALNDISISESEDFILLNGNKIEYPVFYTGALDEFFGCSEGKLPYRSLKFEWVHEDINSFQDAAVIAYPQEKDFTRISEFKKMPVQDVRGTTYAIEYPLPYNSDNDVEPYYPLLTEESKQQYEIYKRKAEKIKNLFCCGRLADFKYYNMDQAIERALKLCENF